MFIQSLKYDYQTAGILVEYVTKSEARQMSSKLIKAIFEKGGELNKFEGFISKREENLISSKVSSVAFTPSRTISWWVLTLELIR